MKHSCLCVLFLQVHGSIIVFMQLPLASAERDFLSVAKVAYQHYCAPIRSQMTCFSP